MANLAKWNTPGAWTSLALTSGDVNSLASGGGALSTTVITNSTGLDQAADFSFVLTVGGTTTSSSLIPIYVLPLNQDGSTYGDGYASSTSTQPAIGYQVGFINVKIGVTSGSTVTGIVQFCNLPAGDCKIVIGNSLGVTFNATAAVTLKYRTYDVNLNG